MQEGNERYKGVMSREISYCGKLVQQSDPDRYLLSMFVGVDRREALWALFAFNLEIAKTRELVTEMQLGHIRLQWWRDALAAVYERAEVPTHQVLAPLAEAIAAYDLPRDLFEELIEAREFDLEDARPDDVEGFVNYCELTNTPLLRLAVLIEGGDLEVEPISVIGANYGLIGCLRAVPHLIAQGRSILPENQEDIEVLAGEIVCGVVANSRILKGAQALSVIYFKQLRGCGYDPSSRRMQIAPAFKVIRVLWAVLR